MTSRTLKSMLMASVAVSGAALSGHAYAQSAPAASDEKVTVTGSRIVRKNLTSVSPVSTLSNVEFKQTGTVSAETLLNNSPLVLANQTSEISNGASGIATVDLRGLGPQRTLVLINGRRMSPGNPLAPTADLNTIPVSLIQRVEIVSGGASAVYGSDALSGAVNFIMKKNFEGVQIDVQYGFAQHTNDDAVSIKRLTDTGNPVAFPVPPKDVVDGESFTTSVTMGANTDDGRGNVTVYASFTNLQELRQDQRDFSACSLTDDGVDVFCQGSSNFNRIFAGGFDPVNQFSIQPGGGIAQWNTRPASERFFNFAPDNFLQRPRDQYQFGAFAHYEVNKHLDFYAEVMMADDYTNAQIAASGAFLDRFVDVNCDNPLLSAAQVTALCTNFGLAGSDRQAILLGRRNLEGGPRQQITNHTNYRIVTGARGEITTGWDYDVYAQHSKTAYAQTYRNEVDAGLYQNALLVDPVTGDCFTDADNCVPLNIWGGIGVGAITPDQLAYISGTGLIQGSVQEQVVSGSVTGDLGTLGLTSPGSDRGAQIAAGVEYRRQFIEYDTSDNFVKNTLWGQGGAQPSQPASHYDVFEAFVELEVPLITDKPFFKLLSVNGGYRVSDYSEAGVSHAHKYGAEWAPSDDIRLRGSVQKATRAPNVLELFAPLSGGLFAGADPCAGAAPTATLAQCQNMGVLPAQYGAIPACPSAQCQTITGGNATLKPETGDTISYGFVFTPTFLKGFSVSVDYFDIEIDDRIGPVGSPTLLNECLAGNLASCAKVTRDPASGALFIAGFGVVDPNVNAGKLITKGYDIEANYTLDLASSGSLALSFSGTILDEYTEANRGAVPFDCKGFFGPVCGNPLAEWRHKARATWATPWDVDLSLAWRRIGATKLDANSPIPELQTGCDFCTFPLILGEIPVYDYFDLSGSWAISENYELRFGVNNIADKNPPLFDSNTIGVSSPPFGNANTFPGQYDSLGREFFIGGTAKF